MWKISQEELFRGSGGAGAQSPPSVLPGGVMPMTSSWGRLGSVQLARAESRVVLHRCRIGKRSAGILSVKQQMGPEKIETWGTQKKNVFASFCDLLRLSNQCCQFGGYILYMLQHIPGVKPRTAIAHDLGETAVAADLVRFGYLPLTSFGHKRLHQRNLQNLAGPNRCFLHFLANQGN
jgi:hypothetical protein